MLHLERSAACKEHVQIVAPAMHYFAAQAKLEQNPVQAFEIADFCHALTNVTSNCVQIVKEASLSAGKGIVKGVKNALNPKRLVDMATGALQLVLLCANEIGQEEIRENARSSWIRGSPKRLTPHHERSE